MYDIRQSINMRQSVLQNLRLEYRYLLDMFDFLGFCMFVPFLFLFFVGCSDRVHRGPEETEKQLVQKEAKSDFTGDVEKVGVEFRRILYEYEYPVPALRRFFRTSNLNAKGLGLSLTKFLRIDPELWGLILEVFFRGWNYHVGAILTFVCRNSVSKCAVISEKLGATVYHRVMNNDNLDPGEFGNVIASIHKSSLNELLPKILSDFDKTILWLNGEQNLQFSDRDVFVGLLRFIITDEFGINGFVCLRLLEKTNRSPNPQWIGAGELKLEGVVPSDIAKCQSKLLEMNRETREVEIYTITHTISESAIIVKDETKWATEFKRIVYTSLTPRSDLRKFFLPWGEEAARYMLAEVLIRSIHIDSFLWEFAYQEIFRRTARGFLTARLTYACFRGFARRRDSDNMAILITTWAFSRTGPDNDLWVTLQQRWQETYVEADGGRIDWINLSDEYRTLHWLNGAEVPAQWRIRDRDLLASIISKIVFAQIGTNGSICLHILKLQGNYAEPESLGLAWSEVSGEDILACQSNEWNQLEGSSKIVTRIVEEYLSTRGF